MGARTSWGSIPPKTAKSDTRPALCTHFLQGRSFAWKGWGRRPSPLPLAVAERPEREASITRWFATPGRAVGGHPTLLGPWKRGGTVPLGDTWIFARKRGRLAENELTRGLQTLFLSVLFKGFSKIPNFLMLANSGRGGMSE